MTRRDPIRIGGFTIKDFHGKHRVLTVPEIFQYSSNIGTAKMADIVGIEGHKEFLTGAWACSTKMPTELPEVKMPSQPREWKKINSITISFGHGVSTTPLQTAVAGAALLNGGNPDRADLPAAHGGAARPSLDAPVIKKSTSDDMRFLFRWNAVNGSGKNARVPGFNVGGKTGTADKVVNGRYSNVANFNAFLAGFPIDDPRYVVLTFIDEPKTDKGNGAALAGNTAAPMVAISSAVPRRFSGSSRSSVKTVLPCLCLIDHGMTIGRIRRPAHRFVSEKCIHEDQRPDREGFPGNCLAAEPGGWRDRDRRITADSRQVVPGFVVRGALGQQGRRQGFVDDAMPAARRHRYR